MRLDSPPLTVTSRLRFLVLCYEWPPVGGGGGRAARDVAEALARRGHQVSVQTVRLLGMPKLERRPNLELHRAWGFRRWPDRCTPPEMAGYLATGFLPTCRRLREFRPDLIHAHFAVPTGPLAWAASRLGRVPYIITTQLGDVPGAIPDQTDHLFRWLNPLIRPVWHKAAAVTTVSPFVADLAQKAYGIRPILIPNGINLAGRPTSPRHAKQDPRLLFVGRLNPQKNLPFLFQLLSELKDLPWTLDVVGDGEQRSALAILAKSGGIRERVRFHGWLTRPDVDSILAASEILIFPSKVEGLPLALLEGLKFGLAMAASDLPPLRELVQPGENGVLITPGDRTAWLGQLRELINDPGRVLRMRQASWASAERFDLERITDRYEAVFAQVLRSRVLSGFPE